MERPGIGPITASALLASIGNGHDFKNGRQVAAWIGLTPGQHSSGGKARLGHITKAGDSYLRSLLVLGARAVLNSLGDKQDYFSCWARGGGDCGEECANRLSGIALWRRLSHEKICGLKTRSKASVGKGITPPDGGQESPGNGHVLM